MVSLLHRRAVRWAVVVSCVVAACLAAAWTMTPKLDLAVHQMAGLPAPSWPWIAAVIAAIALSYVLSAVQLSVAAGRHFPLLPAVLVQLAAATANRLTPAGVGGLAINTRFLIRQGLSIGQAAAVVAARGLAYAVVSVSCVAVLGPSVAASFARNVLQTVTGVPIEWLAVGAVGGGAAVASGGVMWSRYRRSAAGVGRRKAVSQALARIRLGLHDAGRTARELGRSPSRTISLVLIAVAVRVANVLALLAALRAFGGGVATWHVAVVYLVGVTTAEAVPMPAGIGTVDAALVIGLVGTGGTAGATLAAVIAYRLLTFWAPVPPGALAARSLRRRMAI
jgi:uncharacterized membrane protein YbhN (UPF0104 family)